VAKIYERMASLRSNFRHPLTHRLIGYPSPVFRKTDTKIKTSASEIVSGCGLLAENNATFGAIESSMLK
jgi:hypothetical protein